MVESVAALVQAHGLGATSLAAVGQRAWRWAACGDVGQGDEFEKGSEVRALGLRPALLDAVGLPAVVLISMQQPGTHLTGI